MVACGSVLCPTQRFERPDNPGDFEGSGRASLAARKVRHPTLRIACLNCARLCSTGAPNLASRGPFIVEGPFPSHYHRGGKGWPDIVSHGAIAFPTARTGISMVPIGMTTKSTSKFWLADLTTSSPSAPRIRRGDINKIDGERPMPRGDKSSYTGKQKRKAVNKSGGVRTCRGPASAQDAGAGPCQKRACCSGRLIDVVFYGVHAAEGICTSPGGRLDCMGSRADRPGDVRK